MQQSTQYWLRVALVVVCVLIVFSVAPVVLPFAVSLVLCLVLLPLVNHLQDWGRRYLRWQGFPRWLAIIPAFFILGLFTALVIIYIIVPFISELTRLINNIPFLIAQFMVLLKNIPLDQSSGTGLPVQVDMIVTTTLTKVGNYSVDLAQRGIVAAFTLAGTMLELLLVPIITFYLLKDGRYLKGRLISIFSPNVAKHLADVIDDIHFSLGRYLRGQLILASNMFVIISIVASVYSLPYPLVLALLAAVAEWIPIIGPFISAGPAIVLAFLISGSLAIKVAITYAVILLIDGQVIMPKVMGKSINLHPLVIISVIFIGGSFYGIVGMMVAVPLTAVLHIIAAKLWFFNLYYRKKKGDNHEHNIEKIEGTDQG